MRLRLATRNSALAMWQAQSVANLINAHYPDCQIEIVALHTIGDKLLNQSLSKIGGKGLFIKELEQALLDNTADIAVHSLKDVPIDLNHEFKLAAILARENPQDAFVSNHYPSLASLPRGSIIGTASARREVFIKRYFPHLEVELLRGNLATRLYKLDTGLYNGIILAVAGLKRLNLESRIREYLAIQEFIPAIGQGALALEINTKRTDLLQLLSILNDPDTFCAVEAERTVGRLLAASCHSPIAVYAQINEGQIRLQAMVANHKKYISANLSGPVSQNLLLAQDLAHQLINRGALDILKNA